jgi:probable F420-dependent oxidoreductase
VVAKQLATIDNLAGGRLVFGIGSGWAREEFEALGVEYADRGPLTDEYLRVIVALWTQPTPAFDGQYVRLHEVHAEPRPLRQPHPPILVGGYGKRAIGRAVAMGQGWLPDGLTLAALRDGITLLRQTAEAARRDPMSLSVVLRTGLELDRVAAGRIADQLETPWEQSATFKRDDRQPFRGSTQQVVDDIGEAESIGVDELIFECPVQRGDERFDTIEAFARDVLPSVRTRPVAG